MAYPYLSGKPLEPDTTFTALSLINQLLEPLYFTPLVTSLLVNAFVGFTRLQSFFLAPEIEDKDEHGALQVPDKYRLLFQILLDNAANCLAQVVIFFG